MICLINYPGNLVTEKKPRKKYTHDKMMFLPCFINLYYNSKIYKTLKQSIFQLGTYSNKCIQRNRSIAWMSAISRSPLLLRKKYSEYTFRRSRNSIRYLEVSVEGDFTVCIIKIKVMSIIDNIGTKVRNIYI